MKQSTWDAPDVTGCGKPFEGTPSRMMTKTLQNNSIKYTHFHFCISICSDTIWRFVRQPPSYIMRVKDGDLKTGVLSNNNNNFYIALFSGAPKLTALYNILQHFLSFTSIIHIIMTTKNV